MEICDMLNERAQQRLTNGNYGDDGYGSQTSPLSYIDDTNIDLPYEDALFFFEQLELLGPPVGIFLSKEKNIIITSTNGISPLPLLPRRLKNKIRTLINRYGSKHGEELNGAKLLGSPLGNDTYSQSFLAQRLQSKCIDPIDAIVEHLDDPHAGFILLRHCIQPCINHLHFTDIATAPLQHQTTTPPTYSTSFSNQVTQHHQRLLQHLAGRNIDDLAGNIATSAIMDGGLGLRNVLANNIQGFIFPLARTLQYATQGIAPLKYSHIESADIVPTLQLAPCHKRLYQNWWLSSQPLLQKFLLYAPPILLYHPELQQIQDPVERAQTFVNHYPLKPTRRRINRNLQKDLFANNMQTVPPEYQHIIPSLMTEYTSLPAASITRSDPDFRWKSTHFHTYLQRKLHLPLFLPPYPQCRCGTTVDPYGDHIYNCPQYTYPRDNIHDNFRNAAYHVLRTLAPIAGFVAETQDVLHEPDNIISENPLLRPAYTALAHESISNQDITYTLIDYSTAIKALQTPSSPQPIAAPQPTTEQVTMLHERAENDKLHGPNRRTTQRPINGETLITKISQQRMILRPWTIDCRGQFGPFAYLTLSGTTHPHLQRNGDRCQTGLGHQAAHYALTRNYHPNAPNGLFPRADKQWIEYLSAQNKHPDTHWFTQTYHARYPSQRGKQILAYTLTQALTEYYYNASRDVCINPNSPKPAPTPDTVPSVKPQSVMAPSITIYVPGTNLFSTLES